MNPINVDGSTKLTMEKLILDGNVYGSKFSVCRFGNFVDSQGSFTESLKRKFDDVVEITDPRMSRYWIKLDKAAQFVLECIEMMEGGEIFIPKMEEKFVMDFVREYIKEPAIKVTGIRLGEKLREELYNSTERDRLYDCADYWVIKER